MNRLRSWLPLVTLGAVTAIEAAGLYSYGGVVIQEWTVCLLALGCVSLTYWALADRAAPPLTPLIRWPAILLPCYAALQITPLPARFVALISPARASIAHSLSPVIAGGDYSTISVVPAEGLRLFIEIVGYAACFFLIRDLSWRLRARRWIVVIPILLLATAEATIAFVQFATAADPDDRVTGIVGTYINHNHFAGFLELSFPLALGCCLSGARRLWISGWSAPAFRRTALAGVAALIFLIAILSSLSRGGLLATLFATLVFCILFFFGDRRWSPKGGLIALGVTALVVIGVLSFLAPQDVASRFALAVNGPEGRSLIWAQTLPLIARFVAVGCGLGGYQSVFLRYNNFNVMETIDFAHNDYLQFLAEMGVIGFSIGAMFFVALIRGTLRVARTNRDQDSRLLAVSCIAAFAAIAFHSILDFNLYIPANAMLLAWISGVAASLIIGGNAAEMPLRRRARSAHSAPQTIPSPTGLLHR